MSGETICLHLVFVKQELRKNYGKSPFLGDFEERDYGIIIHRSLVRTRQQPPFFVPTHKRPELNSLLILFLNSSKSEFNRRINCSLCLRRECAKSIHKSSPPTPSKGHSPFGAQVDANAFFELDSRIVCFFAYMVPDQARFIRTNDLFSLAFFDFYPQNATGRGLFLRVHAPQTFS